MWGSLLIFLAGIIYRAFQMYRLTSPKEQAYYTTVKIEAPKPVVPAAGKDKPAAEQKPAPAPKPVQKPAGISGDVLKYEQIARFRNSILGKHPVMAVVSAIFHFCLFVTPVFVLAHILIVRETLGFGLPTFPDGLSDFLTIICIACCIFFLVRRLAVPTVSSISSFADYFVLLLTAAPFVTGFLAYHHIFTYKHIIMLHMVTGEALLVLVPFTKLGHMAFFFIARYLIDGEYTLGRGTRTWSVQTNG